MKTLVSEIQIIPIKPEDGLIGFASVVLDDSLYLGSIGLHRRYDGTFRITYPTKKVGKRELNIYHPINRETGSIIENAIIEMCEDVFQRSDEENDRHDKVSHQDGQTTLFKS